MPVKHRTEGAAEPVLRLWLNSRCSLLVYGDVIKAFLTKHVTT